MELSTSSTRSLRGAVSALPQALSNQTVLIALLAGVMWNMSGLNLPGPADKFLHILGQAAIPLALVAIGGTLATVSVRRSTPAPLNTGNPQESWGAPSARGRA